MNRLTITFLALLAMATLSAGVAYDNARLLAVEGGGVLNALLLTISALSFTLAMLLLSRILYLTAPKRTHAESVK